MFYLAVNFYGRENTKWNIDLVSTNVTFWCSSDTLVAICKLFLLFKMEGFPSRAFVDNLCESHDVIACTRCNPRRTKMKERRPASSPLNSCRAILSLWIGWTSLLVLTRRMIRRCSVETWFVDRRLLFLYSYYKYLIEPVVRDLAMTSQSS